MHNQLGISFIEIIVSFLILSILLLGLDAMQITALREAKTNYYFSLAKQQLHNMTEYLDATAGEDYSEQLVTWNKQNAEVLPQGFGKIKQYDHTTELAIFWGDFSHSECQKNKIGLSGCLQMTINI